MEAGTETRWMMIRKPTNWCLNLVQSQPATEYYEDDLGLKQVEGSDRTFQGMLGSLCRGGVLEETQVEQREDPAPGVWTGHGLNHRAKGARECPTTVRGHEWTSADKIGSDERRSGIPWAPMGIPACRRVETVDLSAPMACDPGLANEGPRNWRIRETTGRNRAWGSSRLASNPGPVRCESAPSRHKQQTSYSTSGKVDGGRTLPASRRRCRSSHIRHAVDEIESYGISCWPKLDALKRAS